MEKFLVIVFNQSSPQPKASTQCLAYLACKNPCIDDHRVFAELKATLIKREGFSYLLRLYLIGLEIWLRHSLFRDNDYRHAIDM